MKQIHQPNTIDLLLLLLIALIWGSAFTSIKLALDDMGAMWTAAIRVFVGFLALLPFFAFQMRFPSSRKIFGLISIVALLNMVIPFILISWAMKHIEAGIGSLLLGTTPFIAMVIGHFTTRDERITPLKIFAVFLAVSGILVLVGADAIAGLGAAAIWAQLSIIVAGACYVCAGFIMRRIDMPPIAFTTFALGAGSLMLVILAFMLSGPPNMSPDTDTVYALLWLGIFPTGFAYVMRYFLVQRVGVSTFALAMNTVPIFGIIIAAILLGEVIEWSTLTALALVLTGLLVARNDTAAKKQGQAG
ncbi:MAG: DMT family transporter [Pseudomonadota bacterium]